ncbi:MAG: hypothetical protein MMC33_006551 [Icmadophila ericetorum]|nr:hypothetical protein [Icmadophila ericetorum]
MKLVHILSAALMGLPFALSAPVSSAASAEVRSTAELYPDTAGPGFYSGKGPLYGGKEKRESVEIRSTDELYPDAVGPGFYSGKGVQILRLKLTRNSQTRNQKSAAPSLRAKVRLKLHTR